MENYSYIQDVPEQMGILQTGYYLHKKKTNLTTTKVDSKIYTGCHCYELTLQILIV